MTLAERVQLSRATEQCNRPIREIPCERGRAHPVPRCACGIRLYYKSRELGSCWKCRHPGSHHPTKGSR